MAADGRHSAISSLNIIFQDALKQNSSTFAQNFDDLVSHIIRPVYSNRFSRRVNRFKSYWKETFKDTHKAFKIKNLDDCNKYGPDCITALALFESTFKMFYCVFNILNKEFDSSMTSSDITWERYYGTMIANMNFQFDLKYEETWKMIKMSKIESPVLAQLDVAASHLQNDLVRLLDLVVPSTDISLVDFLGLMGYSNQINMKNFTLQTNTPLENDTVCLEFDDHFGAAPRQLNILNDLHPLPTLDPMIMEAAPCELGIYLAKWIEYLNTLKNLAKSDSASEGNSAIHMCNNLLTPFLLW